MKNNLKIGIVAPIFGEDILGGAEIISGDLAKALISQGIDIEIITTCAKEHHAVNNYYSPGETIINGIRIKRFGVSKIDLDIYLSLTTKILELNGDVDKHIELAWIQNSLNSNDMYEYIKNNKDRYDYFFFLPYLRGITYYGTKICPEKSILIPFLHDEAFAYMNIFKEMFERQCRGIIFHSESEKNLAVRLYKINNKPKIVTGFGFDSSLYKNQDNNFENNNFRNKYNVSGDYILYSGRLSIMKNVSLLVDYFIKYKESNVNDLKLVLIGKGDINIPKREDIIHIGFVPYRDKSLIDAYSSATLLCQPSVHESFSIVIMESWLCGVPVLVHENCEVTKDHCITSNGGLYFSNYEEFDACVSFILLNDNIRKKLGENGRNYVLKNYNWKKVLEIYKNFLFNIDHYDRMCTLKIALIGHNVMLNDATGNNMFNKINYFLDRAKDINVYCNYKSNNNKLDTIITRLSYKELKNNVNFYESDIYIFDYPIYYDLLETIKTIKNKNSDKKIILDYAGITPPKLWGNYTGKDSLELAIKKLKGFIRYIDYAIVHSDYMKNELISYGLNRDSIFVLPYVVPIENFGLFKKDKNLIQMYGLTNKYVLLYVGRMAGNKRIDLLIRCLAKVKEKIPNIALLLVGDYQQDAYRQHVDSARRLAYELGVSKDVIFTGEVRYDQLYKYYNLCDIYITTSLHEGFCIPLIEAMACGKPVVGSDCTAIPETIGDTGLTFEPENIDNLAEKVVIILQDESLKQILSIKGLEKAKNYSLNAYFNNIDSIMKKIIENDQKLNKDKK